MSARARPEAAPAPDASRADGPGPAAPDGKLRERAYRAFQDRIVARDIRPGQFVSQRELVRMTGVSLGAIRELVPRLEAEGLILTIPQRGMQVAPVDLQLIRNAFQFRLVLEREAVRSFAKTASNEAIAEQKRAHEAVLDAGLKARGRTGGSASVVARAQAVDLAFHEALIDGLANDIISKAYRVNWIKIRLIRHNETGLLPDLVVPVMRAHLDVIDALERRDADAAEAALERHILGSRDRALGLA